MDDDEIQARFAGLRIAVAVAIKAASRGPADLALNVASLREVEALIPASVHPAVKEELLGVVAALTKLPVRDPTANREVPPLTLMNPIEPLDDDAQRELLT